MAQEAEATGSTSRLRSVGGLRTVAFYATVVALIGLMSAFLGDTLVFLFTSWFVGDPGPHHLHDLAFVAMLWTVLVGLAVQLYRPERRVAAIQQAVLVNVLITGSNLLTGFFFPPALILGGLLFVAFALHPAGWDVLRIRTAGPVRPLLVGLVIVASLPLMAYAAEQYTLHGSGDVHAELGHYADMITYVATIVLLGVLASVQSVGWRVPLWCAAGLAVVFGLSSILHPTLASSVGIAGGSLAVLWGIGFVLAGEGRLWRSSNAGPG